MKKTWLAFTVLLLISAACGAYGQQPQKIELRMAPEESRTYDLLAETTTDYVSHRTGGAERRSIAFKSDMKVLLRCTKVSDEGLLDVEITYPAFTMETIVREGGSTLKITTDKDGARSYVDGKLTEQSTWESLEKQGNPNLKELFGSVIGFTLDPRGRVLEARAPTDVSERFAGVDMKEFFRHQIVFPGVPIAPGAEWNDSSEREVPRGSGPLGGKIMIDETTYTYKGNETAMGQPCARIEMRVTSRPKGSVPRLKTFKQTNQGSLLIALANGQLVASEIKLYQEMEATLGGVETELKTTGQVKTTLVPSSAAPVPAAETAPVDAK